MAGANFFSTIDLAHRHFQIPISEDDKAKTAFRTRTDL